MSREIDALIAEHVMGLDPKIGLGGNFLNYSTDIAAAWEVVEKMECIQRLRRMEDGWCVSIFDDSAYGETPAMAICLAALKAKGIEVGGE